MSEDPLPRRFGPYLLFDNIGQGGMAQLYLGHDQTSLGGERLVVVKQVLPILGDSQEFCRLLTQEAKLAAQLTHRNITQVVDLGRAEGMLYIAMEYVEGFDLRDLLRECSKKRLPLPVQYALLVLLEVLRGLDYAHKKQDESGKPLGIVHRDVSPSNVLISFEGDVKLCDFGIALAFGADARLPDAGIQGKAGYMSPEAASGNEIDERSDVFAAGIILWELLNGRRLYRGENRKAPTLEMAAEASIPPLKQRGYPAEDKLHAIVHKALQKNVDQRYPNAQSMRSDLEHYVRESGLFASPIKFGNWLTQHFADEILERRRTREVAARALARGPLVKLSLSGTPPPVTTDIEPEPDNELGAKVEIGVEAGVGAKAETGAEVSAERKLQRKPEPELSSEHEAALPADAATPSTAGAQDSRSDREPASLPAPRPAAASSGAAERRPPKALVAAAALVVMLVVIALMSL